MLPGESIGHAFCGFEFILRADVFAMVTDR